MKKFICTVVIAAAFCQFLQAQPPHPPGGPANPPQRPTVKQRIDRLNDTLAKALHISATQQKSIDDAFMHFFAQADKLMGDNPPPRPDAQDEKGKQMHEQILTLQKQRDEAIAKVLTTDAFKKYQEIEKNMRPGGGGQPTPPPPKP